MATIIQWNINGLKGQFEMLEKLISDTNSEIICLQETNLKEDQQIKLKNYTCFNKNRTDCRSASGGVGLIVTNRIHSQEFHLNTEIEAVAAKLIINNKPITICNIYLSHRYKLDKSQLENLILQLDSPFLILGDFNSHNSLWGSHTSDARGKIIEDLLNKHNNLVLLNDLSPTHFNIAHGTESAIDLSLCSSNIATLLDWQTLNFLYGSDHYPIILKFDQAHSDQRSFTPKYKWYKADWVKYKHIIRENLTNLNNEIKRQTNENHLNIDNLIAKLNEIIITAADLSIPTTISSSKKTTNKPWWNTDCEEAIKKYKKSFNSYKKNKTMENKIEYKRLRAIARRTIKNNKTQSWLTYLNSINFQIPIKEMWNKIKAIEGRYSQIIPALEEDNKIISDPSEITELLAKKFAKNSSDSNYSKEFLDYKLLMESQSLPSDNDNSGNDEPIALNRALTIEELIEVIHSSKNTSPGPDNIPNILIKELPSDAVRSLLDIYNIIWIKQVFPKTWKSAIVIPILKPNKNKTDKDSYRPISLTCCLCKILEKIVNKRLRGHLEDNNIISKFQSGFRENCSSTDCLTSLESNINDAFNNKQHLIAVCLDMEKAYDLVWRRRILELLTKQGLTGNIFHFVKNFLNDRTCKVKVNNILSNSVNIDNGVPQGSVISVTIFLLAINDIVNLIQPPVSSTIFADDITLFIKGKNTNTSQEILQNALNNIVKFSNTAGFKISKAKRKQ